MHGQQNKQTPINMCPNVIMYLFMNDEFLHKIVVGPSDRAV